MKKSRSLLGRDSLWLEDRVNPSAIVFDLDPALSAITLSGNATIGTTVLPAVQQQTGSLTTRFDGFLSADYDPSLGFIRFYNQPGNTLVAQNTTNPSTGEVLQLHPLPSGQAGTAPANFGVIFNGGLLLTVQVALRDLVGTLHSAPQPLSPPVGGVQQFPPGQVLTILDGTASFGEPGGLLGGVITPGFTDLNELTTNNKSTSQGSIMALGGNDYSVNMPFTIPIVATVPVGSDTAFVNLTISGTLVGTGTLQPNDKPVITSNGGGATAAISIPENTTAVTTVTATDANGQTPTFSIVGGRDAALFGINPTTGALSFLSPPDFENQQDGNRGNDYEVIVQASDGILYGDDQQLITVSVTDAPPSVTANPDNAYSTPLGTQLAVPAPGVLANDTEEAPTSRVVRIYQEGFEGLSMRPFQTPILGGGDGTDWASTPSNQSVYPIGWTVVNTSDGTPGGTATPFTSGTSPPEYYGFNVLDVDSWATQQQASQQRTVFTKGGIGFHGSVLVAESDGYDDATNIDPNLFNTFASTPDINWAGIEAGTLALEFDSSFRPDDPMTGVVEVSFDGGANWATLLTLNEASSGGNGSLSRANERVVLPVPGAGAAGTARFRFSMRTAGNNWWWAIDNVTVVGSEAIPPLGATQAVEVSDPQNAVALNADGSFTYNPPAGFTGPYSFTYRTVKGALESDPTTVTIDVQTLRVTSLTPTVSGFVVTFNAPVDPATVNLYDSGGTLGAADVTLTRNGTEAVSGSLIFNAARTEATFVRTGGPLLEGSYDVVLRSSAAGFVHTSGSQFDGDANGTTGDDYNPAGAEFVVAAAGTPIVSIPDFARGYGQPVVVPASSGVGLPVLLSDLTGANTVEVDLLFDNTLLNIVGAVAGPNGGAVALAPIAGGIHITVNGLNGAAGTNLPVAILTATIPDGAPYANKQVLDLQNALVNAAAARSDDGVHIVAYFGDTTGNRAYSGQDAAFVSRVASGTDSGFVAFQLADPVIIADTTGNGAISGQDASLVSQKATGLVVAQIPDIPTLPAPPAGGPDPRLYFTAGSARPGERTTLALRMQVTDTNGIRLDSADLVFQLDPAVFRILGIRGGEMVPGFALASNPDHQTGVVRTTQYGVTGLEFDYLDDGVLVYIDVEVRADAPVGGSALNILAEYEQQRTQLNEGQLVILPGPTNAADDAGVDATFEVIGPTPTDGGKELPVIDSPRPVVREPAPFFFGPSDVTRPTDAADRPAFTTESIWSNVVDGRGFTSLEGVSRNPVERFAPPSDPETGTDSPSELPTLWGISLDLK